MERPIPHRIVTDHQDGTYATAGDASADVDSTPLVREQIIGQARLLVPFIGLPALWLGTGQHLPLGLWATATVAALFATLATAVDARTATASRPGTLTGVLIPGVYASTTGSFVVPPGLSQ